MTKKKLNKHDLKEDPLLDFFMKAYEFIKTHQNVVFIALIALILIVAGSFWYKNSRQEARFHAANRLSEASMLYYSGDSRSAAQVFELVRDNFGGTREAAHASFYLGRISNETGEYSAAIEHFENYLSKADKFPFFRHAAERSIAIALENNREFVKAAEKYVQIADGEKNEDRKAEFLERAAECYELANMDSKAAEILKRVLPYREGIAASEIEVKIDILSH